MNSRRTKINEKVFGSQVYNSPCYHKMYYEAVAKDRHAERYQRNKDLQRAYVLQKKYGISPEQFDEMMEKQKGGCAICGNPPKKLRLNIDHNHKTKKVRGLLCHMCNRALGLLRVDSRPNIAQAILRYLETECD